MKGCGSCVLSNGTIGAIGFRSERNSTRAKSALRWKLLSSTLANNCAGLHRSSLPIRSNLYIESIGTPGSPTTRLPTKHISRPYFRTAVWANIKGLACMSISRRTMSLLVGACTGPKVGTFTRYGSSCPLSTRLSHGSSRAVASRKCSEAFQVSSSREFPAAFDRTMLHPIFSDTSSFLLVEACPLSLRRLRTFLEKSFSHFGLYCRCADF